ncbi:MAG TPA: cell division protein FtsK, partial [Mycobacterium sp.]|nr:cell division protein FtsK [Mycobacterium sp.]
MSGSSNSKSSSNSQSCDDEWIGELIWSLVKAAGHLLWWAMLFPAISVPIIISAVVGIRFGVRAGMVTSIAVIVTYGLWAWFDQKSFESWVVEPVRRRWLIWWRYSRCWESVCTLHGLTAKLGERTLVPVLRALQIGHHTDVLDLRLVTGQSVTDWQKQAEALA